MDDEHEDKDDDEEAAAEPPCRFALVAFLATLGEPPGVAGIDLLESSCTSMISKLSWLSVLDDFFTISAFMPFRPELFGRGRDFGPVLVTCAAGELSAPATCFVFPICSRRSGNFALLEPPRFVPLASELLLLFVEPSWRFKTSFRRAFAFP